VRSWRDCGCTPWWSRKASALKRHALARTTSRDRPEAERSSSRPSAAGAGAAGHSPPDCRHVTTLIGSGRSAAARRVLPVVARPPAFARLPSGRGRAIEDGDRRRRSGQRRLPGNFGNAEVTAPRSRPSPPDRLVGAEPPPAPTCRPHRQGPVSWIEAGPVASVSPSRASAQTTYVGPRTALLGLINLNDDCL
jgi:hypothetical protein